MPLRGDVRFQDVTFGYESEHPILKDISLFAKPGQKIAFVGSTGAGKTTITNPVSYTHLDEIGQLGRMFNSMVQKNNKLLEEKYELTIHKQEAELVALHLSLIHI